MTHFDGLEVQLKRALALGYEVHSLHQDGADWHCRLKIWKTSMSIPRYASGDDRYPGDAVNKAIANAEEVLAWRPTLGTITRLKELKPSLEALLKEI